MLAIRTALIFLSICMTVGQANSQMQTIADQIVSVLESKIPSGIAGDQDLTEIICAMTKDYPLENIYKEMKNDQLASYIEADGYDIISIERHHSFGTTELRILRNQANSECTALLFNKHL